MTVSSRETRTVMVAGVQMRSEVGHRGDNLDRAWVFLREAAARGAQVVAFPELGAPGYTMSDSVWQAAERADGPSVRWACLAAREHRTCVGMGFVEAERGDLYNSYVVAGPDGQVLGIVRKRRTEFRVFRAGRTAQVVDTPVGRIGIGICADNHYADFPRRLYDTGAELVVMPHAWPAAVRAGGVVTEADVEAATALTNGYAALMAGIVGTPALFVNQVGAIPRDWPGLLGRLLDPDLFAYGGGTSLCDASGRVCATGGRAEGVVAGPVVIDPGQRRWQEPAVYGGWLHPGNPVFRHVFLPAAIVVARMRYQLSGPRREAARLAAHA